MYIALAFGNGKSESSLVLFAVYLYLEAVGRSIVPARHVTWPVYVWPALLYLPLPSLILHKIPLVFLLFLFSSIFRCHSHSS